MMRPGGATGVGRGARARGDRRSARARGAGSWPCRVLRGARVWPGAPPRAPAPGPGHVWAWPVRARRPCLPRLFTACAGRKKGEKLRAVGEYSTSCTARRGRRRALSLSHVPERARHVAAQARDCGLPVILGHVDGLRHGRAAAVRRFVQQPVQERIVQPGRELLQPQPEAWEVVQEVVTRYGTAFLRVRVMSCCKPAVLASESTRIPPHSAARPGSRTESSRSASSATPRKLSSR